MEALDEEALSTFASQRILARAPLPGVVREHKVEIVQVAYMKQVDETDLLRPLKRLCAKLDLHGNKLVFSVAILTASPSEGY